LLPPKFTLLQLQNLYEAIYETALDRRNFTKRIRFISVLQKLNEKEKKSSRKGSYYYIFDKANYKKLQHRGIKFI
jgi:hypothetical protein